MQSLLPKRELCALKGVVSKRLDELPQMKSFIAKTPTNGYASEVRSAFNSYGSGVISDDLLRLTEVHAIHDPIERVMAQQSAIQAREYHNNRHLDGLSDYDKHFLHDMSKLVEYRTRGVSSPRIDVNRDREHLERTLYHMSHMSYPMKRILLDFYQR